MTEYLKYDYTIELNLISFYKVNVIPKFSHRACLLVHKFAYIIRIHLPDRKRDKNLGVLFSIVDCKPTSEKGAGQSKTDGETSIHTLNDNTS